MLNLLKTDLVTSIFSDHSAKRLGINYGEGNGTPLQHSCLENPMDGGAWWTESDTTEVTYQQQQQHRKKKKTKHKYMENK